MNVVVCVKPLGLQDWIRASLLAAEKTAFGPSVFRPTSAFVHAFFIVAVLSCAVLAKLLIAFSAAFFNRSFEISVSDSTIILRVMKPVLVYLNFLIVLLFLLHYVNEYSLIPVFFCFTIFILFIMMQL